MYRLMTPTRFPAAIAARLFGVSLPTFDRMSLPAEPWSKHRRYTRETLELALGRPITDEMVAEAAAAAEPSRAKVRARRYTKKETSRGDA
jgi:hypothetical protein